MKRQLTNTWFVTKDTMPSSVGSCSCDYGLVPAKQLAKQ